MSLLLIDAPPSFLGGVTQQSPVHALPTQCKAMENCWASPVDGLIPRHPTDHLTRHFGSELGAAHGGPFAFYGINRGENEKYTIAAGSFSLLAQDAETGEKYSVLAPNVGTVVLNTVPAISGTDPKVVVDAAPSGSPKNFIFKIGGGVDADPDYYIDTTVYNTTTLALNQLAVKIRSAFGANSVDAFVSNGVLTAYDAAPPNSGDNPTFLSATGGDSATSIAISFSNLARFLYTKALATPLLTLITPENLSDNQGSTQEDPAAGVPATIPWKSFGTAGTIQYSASGGSGGPFGSFLDAAAIRGVSTGAAQEAYFYYRFVKAGEATHLNTFAPQFSWQVFSCYVKAPSISASDEISIGFLNSSSTTWYRAKFTFTGAAMNTTPTLTGNVKAGATSLGFGWYRIWCAYKTASLAEVTQQRRPALYYGFTANAQDKNMVVYGALLEHTNWRTTPSDFYVPAHRAYRMRTIADTTIFLNTTKVARIDSSKVVAAQSPGDEFYLWPKRVNYDWACGVRVRAGTAVCKVATLTTNSASDNNPSAAGALNGPARCIGHNAGNSYETAGGTNPSLVDELCECGVANALQDWKKGVFFKHQNNGPNTGAYRLNEIGADSVARDIAFKSSPPDFTAPTYNYQSGNLLGTGAGTVAGNNGIGNQGLKHFLTVTNALKPFSATTITWPNNATNTVTVAGPVVRVTSATNFDEVETFDSDGGESFVAIHKEVDRADDLPPYAQEGFRVRVKGDNDSELDDYFAEAIKIEPAGGFCKVKWVESTNYGAHVRFDASTMPHSIIRKIDTTGVKTGIVGKKYFELNRIAWDEKIAGDDTLNEDPSFVGFAINDIEFDRGRLWLASQQRVIGSSSNLFYNFWRTTVRRLDDDDPIDVDASHGSVPLLNDMVAIGGSLIARSDLTLFKMFGDPLTPRTAEIGAIEEHPSYSSIHATVANRSIMMAVTTQGGAFTTIAETVSSEEGGTIRTREASEQAPSYIAGKAIAIAASSQAGTLAVLADGNQSHLYIYRFQGDEAQRIQSSWWRYDFGADSKIHNIAFIEDYLYLLILRGYELVVEKMKIGQALKDTGYGWLCHLDRRVNDDTSGLFKELVSGNTRVTLPYRIDPNATPLSCKRSDGTQLTILSTDTTTVNTVTVSRVTLSGDQTAVDLWVGQQFNSSYELSKHQVRDDSGLIQGPRQNSKKMYLSYNNTCRFSVEVTSRNSGLHTIPFAAPNTGTSYENIAATATSPAMDRGRLQIGTGDVAEQLKVVIKNVLYFPFSFSKGEMEVEYIDADVKKI